MRTAASSAPISLSCSSPSAPAATRLAAGAEAGEQDVEQRAVHRLAHELGEDRARRADQGAGDEQRVVAEHEAGRGHRDAGVAVEQRDDDRHVRAADRHRELHAEDERQADEEEEERDARLDRGQVDADGDAGPAPAPPVTSCEPGYFTGREAMTPWSLPQATTEPVSDTEPMIAPSSVAMTKASGSSSPGWRSTSRRNSTTATSAAAPPPAPLKMATICGMAVIATRFAPSQPAIAPMAPPTTMIHQLSSMPARRRGRRRSTPR